MHILHTQTSDAPLKLASEGIPFMILTDLGKQTNIQKVTKGNHKVGENKIQ